MGRQLGIQNIILEPFDQGFAQHSAEWFIDEITRQSTSNPKTLVVGYDFHFGRARSGTIEMIRESSSY